MQILTRWRKNTCREVSSAAASQLQLFSQSHFSNLLPQLCIWSDASNLYSPCCANTSWSQGEYSQHISAETADISGAVAHHIWEAFVLMEDEQQTAKGKLICYLLSPFKFIYNIWLFIWWCTHLIVFCRLQQCTKRKEFPLSLWIFFLPFCFAFAGRKYLRHISRQYKKFQTLKLIVLWQNPQEVW